MKTLSWTPRSPRYIHMHHENRFVRRVIISFPFSSIPGLDFLWAAQRVLLERQDTLPNPMHLVHAPNFYFSGFRVAHLLVWFIHFNVLFLVILCSLLCVSGFKGLVFFLDCTFWFPQKSWFPWLLSYEISCKIHANLTKYILRTEFDIKQNYPLCYQDTRKVSLPDLRLFFFFKITQWMSV